MEKTEVAGIYRDDTGALINKNNTELLAYKRRKEDRKTVDALKLDVANLKDRLTLLEDFIKRLNTNIF